MSQAPGTGESIVARFDRTVDEAFDHLRGHKAIDRVMYAASELGDFSLIWHLVGVARGVANRRDEGWAIRVSATLAAESILVNGVIKPLFNRQRPVHDGERPHRLRQPHSSSFPSGHASAAFCAAAVLSERHRRGAPLYYGLAVVVATSRIHVKIHHGSDVVAGAAIGAGLGWVARRAWARLAPESSSRR